MSRCDAKTKMDRRCRNRCVKGLTTCYIHSDECSICLDRLGTGTTICKLYCGHIFHEQCVQRWINTDGRCPNCRFVCRAPVITVHDISNIHVPESRIAEIIRRLYNNGELNTNRVSLITEGDMLMVNDYLNGTFIGSEPFSL